MFPYHEPLGLPDMPLAIACALERRYVGNVRAYGARWARLDDMGALPASPEFELYDYAESTLKTFRSTEEWYGDIGHPNPVLLWDREEALQSWLDVTAFDETLQPLQRWRDAGHFEYPTPVALGSTWDWVRTGWIIWHMHQLLLAEQLFTVQSLGWREANPAGDLE